MPHNIRVTGEGWSCLLWTTEFQKTVIQGPVLLPLGSAHQPAAVLFKNKIGGQGRRKR